MYINAVSLCHRLNAFFNEKNENGIDTNKNITPDNISGLNI